MNKLLILALLPFVTSASDYYGAYNPYPSYNSGYSDELRQDLGSSYQFSRTQPIIQQHGDPNTDYAIQSEAWQRRIDRSRINSDWSRQFYPQR